jgi:hypothetical protein
MIMYLLQVTNPGVVKLCHVLPSDSFVTFAAIVAVVMFWLSGLSSSSQP